MRRKIIINDIMDYEPVKDLKVNNNKVIVNGNDITSNLNINKGDIIELHINGDVHSIETDASVICKNVTDYVNAKGSVNCQDIGGDVDAGGSVSCGNINGFVDAGGSVNCNNVAGNIDAGGSINVKSIHTFKNF